MREEVKDLRPNLSVIQRLLPISTGRGRPVNPPARRLRYALGAGVFDSIHRQL